MKATLEVMIKKEGGGGCVARLDVELPFPPTVDMPVDHVAWKGSRKVTSVSMQIEGDNEVSIMVILEPEHAKNEGQHNQIVERYKLSGWKIIFDVEG